MKEFLNDHFLLDSEPARVLYQNYAKEMPIIDYHCHINPREIWKNRRFENLTQLWLEGDHYKWRMMRSQGIEEQYITGKCPDKEKFIAFVSALERSIGNPIYHWCHMELRNYFNYNGVLSSATAEEVWVHCQKKMETGAITVRNLIAQSNVRFIGTTDDPTDTLEWHQKLAENPVAGVVVTPSFRPDKALNIDKPDWNEYLEALGHTAGMKIDSVAAVKQALSRRMDVFGALGCKASDHGLDYVCCRPANEAAVEAVFRSARNGGVVTREQAEQYKTALLTYCAGEYTRRGWAMQIHFNCLRNPNGMMLEQLGPDSGFDCINTVDCTTDLAALLNLLYQTETLPRTVIYSLNPGDDAVIDTLIGAFQKPGIPGYVQHGSAWWFNDTKTGMQQQLTSLANLGILGNFIGMLTDSRSFLSYARHEYFRRILCQLIGKWIADGELPADMDWAGGLVQDICCRNAQNYFGLQGK